MRGPVRLLRNPHFWAILIIFFACVILHYPEQMPFLRGSELSSLLGLSRHTVERVLFLAPVIYAGFIFGLKGGIISLVAASAAMLPRVFFISLHPRDALFETLAIVALGALINWWHESQRKESGRREQALLKLEAIRRELQSYIEVIKQNENRLSTLRSICTTVNQSLALEEVLDTAADKIKEVMDIDAILIFFLDEETGRLELRAHRGISEEFASGVAELRVGEGFNGWVAQTGEPCFIVDSALDPRLSREVVKREGIKSQFIVPLKSKDKVIGTLCVAAHTVKQLTSEERVLLTLVGVELGVAAEKAHFYQEAQRIGRRFQEIFEKAHDAIWVQDLQGKIIAANQASARLTGYERGELIGRYVSQFLTSQGLELAGEVRRSLLSGEETNQPYEQRIVRKDGTEAILLLTTSLLGDEGMPLAFQHIARDITEERKLQENLRLYATQISKAHEEERERIARELHDDTIQTMAAASRRLDSFVSGNSTIPKEDLNSLEKLQREINDALIRTRRFIQDLRPPTLEYLGLIPALRELTTQVQEQFGIEVNLAEEGLKGNLASEEELLIYRIVQEALRNIGKHSEATQAKILVNFGQDNTTIEISDNGKGFEVGKESEFLESGKLGLMGMKERAHLLGGSLSIHSKPNSGTKVILDIPNKNLVV